MRFLGLYVSDESALSYLYSFVLRVKGYSCYEIRYEFTEVLAADLLSRATVSTSDN